MKGTMRAALLGAVVLLMAELPAAAQAHWGDLTGSMSGYISPGYSATSSNVSDSSSHSFGVGGNATMNGYYYAPGFLTYTGSVYVDQSRANSDFKSISTTSGFNIDNILFTGSHYPGAIGYSRTYDAEGSYNVPGLANYVTHGNGDAFNLQWGETVPSWPTFTASYLRTGSDYTVYGAEESGNSHSNLLNLRSTYAIDGYRMGLFYSKSAGTSEIPAIVTSAPIAVNSSGDTAGFNVSHMLPWSGSAALTITRSSWNDTIDGSQTGGTVNQLNATASIHPVYKLSLATNLSYTDNLNGLLTETVIGEGGLPTSSESSLSSNSLDSITTMNYAATKQLQTSLFFERRQQSYEGAIYSESSYGGGAVYSHHAPGGSINGALSLSGNFGGNDQSDSLGFTANANYAGLIHNWRLNGQFSYSQNVQTLLVTYTNSFYNFSGNLMRRWGQFNMSLGGNGSRTGVTDVAGLSSTSQGYSASLGYGVWLEATGNYAKSSGTGLLTASGLGPVPPVGTSSLVSLYGGDSYSATLASSPVRHMVMSATYEKAITNTNDNGVNSNNVNAMYTAQMTYQVRKLYVTTGYERLLQGFSGTGTPTQLVYSYYFGVSRWFKFF